MHLQTTLILSSSHVSFKTNQRSQFSNFCHPLKVLQKADNQVIELMTKQALTMTNGFGEKSMRSTKDNFRQAAKESKNNTKKPQFFNQDEGILQHIYQKSLTFPKPTFTPHSSKPLFQPRSTKQCKWFHTISSNQQKCFILFGFSINLLQIQQFHTCHPQLNLNIKFYKYGDSDYFKEVEIRSLEEETLTQRPGKYQSVVEALGGEDVLDCEEVSFVVSYWENGVGISERHNGRGEAEDKFNKKKTYVYFFPNINALRSQQQRRQQRTQLTLGLPTSTNTDAYRRKLSSTSQQPEPQHQTLTSLRKSHQNFRILQVLQYYLKLECHSQHIMITSNQSRIIKQFLDLIYEQSLKDFFVFIDHERKGHGVKSKSTVRSILAGKNNTRTHNRDNSIISYEPNYEQQREQSSPSSKVYTSDICSEKQFISIDGQLIINDEFLSKLSQLKLPEPWLDSAEFREQKKLMYKMKLQEYTESKELKKMKDEFTDTINYLKSLIGLEKVTYDEISIDSLKVIKNAKIRQATQQVKQLENIWQQKQIRSEELKQKLKQYETQKHAKNGDHQHNLSQLRKDILAVQKQLNLHRNQLSAIYDAGGQKENVQGELKKQEKIQGGARCSKETQVSCKPLERSTVGCKIQGKSSTQNLKSQLSSNKSTNLASPKPKAFTQAILTTTSQQPQKQPAPKAARHSAIKGLLNSSKIAMRAESFLANRRSSQLLSKYAPILQQLRKQKYEQSLKQQMTKCEFEAQKQYEKYKEEYTRACRELRLVLNDCD